MAAVIDRGDYGHFSPIRAYDTAHDRVLILDVYRVELGPYWGAGGAAVRWNGDDQSRR